MTCSSMCYQNDYSLFLIKSSSCFCTNWNVTDDDDDDDDDDSCKVQCKDDLNKYCGTQDIRAVYSVCGKLSWGHGCQMICMCESEFCDIVDGRCTEGGCVPGFQGERCDWWDDTLINSLWSLTIRSFIKEALDLGIISKTGDYLHPISKDCPAGSYGRACTMNCKCINSSACLQATGVCIKGTCQDGWVGKRCDREAPCRPSKCLNGAMCTVKTSFSYFCECPLTFLGVHCEYKNPCMSNPCRNRGTCSNVGLFFKCHCTHKFAGEMCQIAVPDSWSVNASSQLLGCYRNLLGTSLNFDLRTYIDHKFMDSDQCVAFCRGKDYTYAGIEAGSACYCANQFIFNQFGAVRLSDCNSTCSGHSFVTHSITPSIISSITPLITLSITPSIIPSITPSIISSISRPSFESPSIHSSSDDIPPSITPSIIPSIISSISRPSFESPSIHSSSDDITPSITPSIISSITPSIISSITPSIISSIIPSISRPSIESPSIHSSSDDITSILHSSSSGSLPIGIHHSSTIPPSTNRPPPFNYECGGEGLVTLYTSCPRNRWGDECAGICMCSIGQCDIRTGVCRRVGVCQYGWKGRRCDEELSFTEKTEYFPSIVIGACLIATIIFLPPLAYYFLIYLPRREYEKLTKLSELQDTVDGELKKLGKILKKKYNLELMKSGND